MLNHVSITQQLELTEDTMGRRHNVKLRIIKHSTLGGAPNLFLPSTR